MPSRNVHAWYALRRTLPPWRFEENLAEMVRVLPRYRVDEVVIKVDVEEFSHGHVSLDWIRRYQERLVRIREAMQGLGIVYSLDPWTTMAFDLDAAAGRGVKDVQVLGRSRRWRSSTTVTTRRAAGRWQIRCRRTVSHTEPLVLRIRRG